ncbi:MAG: hypothetical protein OEM03_01405 [Chromatiales bacterium]|nr:hypothetical protein [Chromatiales bacterium]
MSTLVIQSHRTPLPAAWLQPCLDSVRGWARGNNFEYRFLGDEIFSPLPEAILQKTADRLQAASDLARLIALQGALDEGYETAIWCDADFLVFAPHALSLPADSYGLGREVWVQPGSGKLRAQVKVHNAFMFFRRGNPFLDFYRYAAQRMLEVHEGPMVPQFVGPKFLTAIHNILTCPVVEEAAMFSPATTRALLAGGGPALELLLAKSIRPPAGANLCSSLADNGELSEGELEQAVDRLLARGSIVA